MGLDLSFVVLGSGNRMGVQGRSRGKSCKLGLGLVVRVKILTNMGLTNVVSQSLL